MLILLHDDFVAFPVNINDRDNFFRKSILFQRFFRTLLTLISKYILFFTRNIIQLSYIFSCLRHWICSVHFLQLIIRKTPANCGINHFHISSRKWLIWLSHDERCTRHTFCSARNVNIAFSNCDCPSSIHNRIETGSRKSINRRPSHFNW